MLSRKKETYKSLTGAFKMNILVSLLLIVPCFATAVDEQSGSEECVKEERVVKFKCPPSYENSRVYDPIERDPVVMRPSTHESSFYEEMTRW